MKHRALLNTLVLAEKGAHFELLEPDTQVGGAEIEIRDDLFSVIAFDIILMDGCKNVSPVFQFDLFFNLRCRNITIQLEFHLDDIKQGFIVTEYWE